MDKTLRMDQSDAQFPVHQSSSNIDNNYMNSTLLNQSIMNTSNMNSTVKLKTGRHNSKLKQQVINKELKDLATMNGRLEDWRDCRNMPDYQFQMLSNEEKMQL